MTKLPLISPYTSIPILSAPPFLFFLHPLIFFDFSWFLFPLFPSLSLPSNPLVSLPSLPLSLPPFQSLLSLGSFPRLQALFFSFTPGSSSHSRPGEFFFFFVRPVRPALFRNVCIIQEKISLPTSPFVMRTDANVPDRIDIIIPRPREPRGYETIRSMADDEESSGRGEEKKEAAAEEGRDWLELTPVCLENVFRWLTFEDRWKGAMLVCRAWLDASCDPSPFRILRPRARLRCRWHRPPRCRCLVDPGHPSPRDSMLRFAAHSAAGSLQEVRVRHCSDDALSFLAERCT